MVVMAAGWVLVPCLVSLRNEFNQLAPNRSKASDGSIGDTSHAASSSDHNADETGNTPTKDADSINEVHAIDVDCSGPWPAGWSMERAVQTIVLRHRNGVDDRLQNVIYNRRIWSRSWGWTARQYTGANPHDHHAHFSARYTTVQENDTRPWGLLEQEDDMPTKSEFLAWLRDPEIKAALAVAVLTYDPGRDATGKIKPGGIENVTASAKENPTVGAAWALRQATVAPMVAYQIRDRVDLLLKKQGISETEMAALRADVAGLPDDVLAELADAGRSPREVADALRAALGDRAAEVGRLLAGA